jgi:hypothetical protein
MLRRSPCSHARRPSPATGSGPQRSAVVKQVTARRPSGRRLQVAIVADARQPNPNTLSIPGRSDSARRGASPLRVFDGSASESVGLETASLELIELRAEVKT